MNARQPGQLEKSQRCWKVEVAVEGEAGIEVRELGLQYRRLKLEAEEEALQTLAQRKGEVAEEVKRE